MTMVIHRRTIDAKGAGRWDAGTTRYVPIQGGSRSRLPIQDDPNYSRYAGFVGVDEAMSGDMNSMAALYGYLGGTPVVYEGHGSVFVGLILAETKKRLGGGGEDAE